jgi:lysophospholipase L1-like esterase
LESVQSVFYFQALPAFDVLYEKEELPMSGFIVEGKCKLHGTIQVTGNKNEALPLIAASLLCPGPVTFSNVPDIGDVRTMLSIATILGANVSPLRDGKVTIGARTIATAELPMKESNSIRASILFASALLLRKGKAVIRQPGGDSIGRRRLDKMLSVMKPGDCLIMQFGTNDQKQIAAGTGGPFTTYKAEIKQHVDAVRARGAFPIIVSPVERGDFDAAGRIKPSLAEYAEASRQAAQELHVPFIDLNALSTRFYEALGPQKLAAAFAMPQTDHTHHNAYGSYELAKCVVTAIRHSGLDLAHFIVGDFRDFDPAHPDPVEKFDVPPSPQFTNQRPLGD